MHKTKPIFTKITIIMAVLLIAIIMSACSLWPAGKDGDLRGGGSNGNSISGETALPDISGALAREDFNFYGGSNIMDADEERVYGGMPLLEGWSTARGFKHGDDLQKFALLYYGFPSIITVTSVEHETAYYPSAVISETVTEISDENCSSVSFVFVLDGYTLTFDYLAVEKEFQVTARSLKENGRLQAFDFLRSVCQYHLFGSYPTVWPDVGHLPWADDVDEMEYLNARNDLLIETERVFMYEIGEAYLESYGIPPLLNEQQDFLASLSESDLEIFDSAGQKMWNWVQTIIQ